MPSPPRGQVIADVKKRKGLPPELPTISMVAIPKHLKALDSETPSIEVIDVVEVLVLYYSRGGRTEALARAVAEGIDRVDGASARLKRVDFATLDDLISCDAVAFGSPNNFGYMAGLMKDFFDRAWSIREKVYGKLTVAFTSGGGSSNSALLSLEKMSSYFKLEKAAEGVVSDGTPSEQDLAACKKMGEALAKASLKRKAEVPKD